MGRTGLAAALAALGTQAAWRAGGARHEPPALVPVLLAAWTDHHGCRDQLANDQWCSITLHAAPAWVTNGSGREAHEGSKAEHRPTEGER